jgi:anti-sigma regulatory factor (Ser/Thr protein kinase)
MTGRRPARFVLYVERSRRGLLCLGAWVDGVSAALALSGPAEYALRLCVEEAVTNVVIHGVPRPETEACPIAVHLHETPDLLRVTIEDCCLAFDPLGAPARGRPATAREARVGGLGILLMRQHARQLVYVRDGATNRLILLLARSGA